MKATITVNYTPVPGPQASQADLQAFADFMRAYAIPQKDGSAANPGDIVVFLANKQYSMFSPADWQAENPIPAQ